MTSWFRSWHGAPTDPKWLLIGKKAGVAPGIVSAIFWALIDHASQSEDRGAIHDFDCETYAAFTGFDEKDISSVIAAMTDKGMINNGRLVSWDKRQPKKEDDSGGRVTAFRERQRNEMKRPVTPGNAPERTEQIEQKEQSRPREAFLDQVEKEIREAAGQEENPSPSLIDISPIASLLDKGWDLARDILPKLREAKAKGLKPNSWRYYEKMITEGKSKNDAIPPKPQSQPAKTPTVWVTEDDPRWPDLAERFKRENEIARLLPSGSRHYPGQGFAFPKEWTETRV